MFEPRSTPPSAERTLFALAEAREQGRLTRPWTVVELADGPIFQLEVPLEHRVALLRVRYGDIWLAVLEVPLPEDDAFALDYAIDGTADGFVPALAIAEQWLDDELKG